MTFEERAQSMNQSEVVALLRLSRDFESKEKSYQSEIKKLQERLDWFQRQVFGKKTERRLPEVSAKQGKLFEVAPSPVAEKKIEIKSHTRLKRQAISKDEENAPEGTFPLHLRREDIPVEFKPEGYSDSELEVFSEKITERLAEEPGEQYVKRYIRKVYKIKESGEPVCAPAPCHIFGRCKVDESFLVLMAIRKFLWHIPLYRQHQMLKLEGVELSRNSFADWTIKYASLLSPIAKALKSILLEQKYLHIDNTPGVVGRGNKKKGKSFDTGYFWPLLQPEIGVYFEFSRDKSYRSFESIIDGYQGTLISDAEEIFEKYARIHELAWQLCWMHSRRNFVEAEKSNAALAAQALTYIRALYQVERDMKERKILDPEKVSRYRAENSSPILVQFKDWLRKTSITPEALTDDLISKAIHYLLSRWQAAILYISDGSIPIDNGADERQIRPLKLGLKNYLFCASEVGAETAATFYTLIHSAKMNGIHPYYYLLDLCKRIDEPGLKADDLVPHIWKTNFFEQAVPIYARFVLNSS